MQKCNLHGGSRHFYISWNSRLSLTRHWLIQSAWKVQSALPRSHFWYWVFPGGVKFFQAKLVLTTIFPLKQKNPKPFFHLARELFPGNFNPTPCHHFMKLIHDKGQLLRLYTQNIDSLERIAGVPGEKLLEAHGTFNTSHCTNKRCAKAYSLEWMKGKLH